MIYHKNWKVPQSKNVWCGEVCVFNKLCCKHKSQKGWCLYWNLFAVNRKDIVREDVALQKSKMTEKTVSIKRGGVGCASDGLCRKIYNKLATSDSQDIQTENNFAKEHRFRLTNISSLKIFFNIEISQHHTFLAWHDYCSKIDLKQTKPSTIVTLA